MDINKYTIEGELHKLPMLVNTNVGGKKQFWEAHVIGDSFYRKSWIDGGKIREFPVTVCTGKNVGRSNETSGHEQALQECLRKWLNQQSKGYTVVSVGKDEGTPPVRLLPMLAQKYTDRSKYIKFPCAASRKLDGIRMLSTFKDGNIILTSRTGKEFKFVEKIRQHLLEIYDAFGSNLVLDGELYSHDLPFSVISGAIRSTRQKSSHDHLLEYWIFDVVDINVPYNERATILENIQHWYLKKYSKSERVIQFELYQLCEKAEQLIEFHDKYVSQGFEGLIVRNLHGKYLLEKRSNDLQKFKNFEDTEFEIVGYKLGTGTEAGAIIFICKSGEKTFDVRPRGSIGDRIEKAKHGDEFVGKQLTVRYQPSVKQSDVDKCELPRFPIGIDVRDYE
jgi:ATP-dependent DNA ligase